jgi:hypothetical protein
VFGNQFITEFDLRDDPIVVSIVPFDEVPHLIGRAVEILLKHQLQDRLAADEAIRLEQGESLIDVEFGRVVHVLSGELDLLLAIYNCQKEVPDQFYGWRRDVDTLVPFRTVYYQRRVLVISMQHYPLEICETEQPGFTGVSFENDVQLLLVHVEPQR